MVNGQKIDQISRSQLIFFKNQTRILTEKQLTLSSVEGSKLPLEYQLIRMPKDPQGDHLMDLFLLCCFVTNLHLVPEKTFKFKFTRKLLRNNNNSYQCVTSDLIPFSFCHAVMQIEIRDIIVSTIKTRNNSPPKKGY